MSVSPAAVWPPEVAQTSLRTKNYVVSTPKTKPDIATVITKREYKVTVTGCPAFAADEVVGIVS